MKIDLLNIIRCPHCKSTLELTIFEIETENTSDTIPKEKEKSLVGVHGTYDKLIEQMKTLNMTKDMIENVNVKYGILYCNSCKRWYPIGNYIPTVPELYYPDNLRNKSKELKFIEKWKDLFPDSVLNHGVPWNLSDVMAQSKEKVNK